MQFNSGESANYHLFNLTEAVGVETAYFLRSSIYVDSILNSENPLILGERGNDRGGGEGRDS